MGASGSPAGGGFLRGRGIGNVPGSLHPRSSASRASTAPARPPRRASTRPGCARVGTRWSSCASPAARTSASACAPSCCSIPRRRIGAARRGAAVRRRARAGRRRDRRAGARARCARRGRPLRRQLARLPGQRARALGDRGRARRQRLRDRRGAARPHGAARAARRATRRERRAGLPEDRIEAEALGLPRARRRGLRGARWPPSRNASCGWSADGDPERSPQRVREAIGGD